jgi:hypothetical protein
VLCFALFSGSYRIVRSKIWSNRVQNGVVISSSYAQNFVVGLFLVFFAENLARKRSFHYFLGASLGICLSAFLELYFFSRQTKSAAKILPGVQLLQSLGSLLSFVIPVTSVLLPSALKKLLSFSTGFLWKVWEAENWMGIPHLGKIYFMVFGLLGCGLVWWNQWGVSNKPSEDKQMTPEESEELGEFEEEVPLSLSQSRLAHFLQLVGLVMLFYSTSSTEMSIILILLVSLSSIFELVGYVLYYWYNAEVRTYVMWLASCSVF